MWAKCLGFINISSSVSAIDATRPHLKVRSQRICIDPGDHKFEAQKGGNSWKSGEFSCLFKMILAYTILTRFLYVSDDVGASCGDLSVLKAGNRNEPLEEPFCKVDASLLWLCSSFSCVFSISPSILCVFDGPWSPGSLTESLDGDVSTFARKSSCLSVLLPKTHTH